MQDNYTEELKLALQMAEKSRNVILEYFNTDFTVEWKRDNTPVTIADKKAEEAIRSLIEKETPDYGIIGEEFGKTNEGSDMQWVIDPIDGTKSFIHGVPLFSTLIALMDKGEPVLGIINMPAAGACMAASKGDGCFVNGNLTKVSSVESIKESLVLCTSVNTMESDGYKKGWTEIRNQAKLHRGWGDAYGYYLVASGKAEVMVDSIAEVWDLAAVDICMREAGGTFTSIKGGDFKQDRSGLASNGLFHDELLGILNT